MEIENVERVRTVTEIASSVNSCREFPALACLAGSDQTCFSTGCEGQPPAACDVSKQQNMATYNQQNDHSRQAVAMRIIVLCMVWFSISSTNNVVGKKILMEFPHPVTLAMVQLVSTAMFLGPTLRMWQVPRHSKIPKTDLLRLILPLAFGKCFSVVSAHISIWRVPVSYAHTGMFDCFCNRLHSRFLQITKIILEC